MIQLQVPDKKEMFPSIQVKGVVAETGLFVVPFSLTKHVLLSCLLDWYTVVVTSIMIVFSAVLSIILIIMYSVTSNAFLQYVTLLFRLL